jgi:Phosphodiester glycosidase
VTEVSVSPRNRTDDRTALPPHTRRGVTAQSRARRRVWVTISAVLSVVVLWLAISLGGALTNPSLGSSVSARFAEWARSHGGASVVNWAENEWYSHHPPKVGGTLAAGMIRHPKAGPAVSATAPPHLPTPAPIVPFASPAVAGEGQWSPSGRPVGGIPAVFETTLRPDAVHTSYVAAVAWMDTKLLKATLYSGSQIPGGGPYTDTAPVSPSAATTLVAAFNAGFLMSDANGGYYTDGRVIMPLRTGAASFVVYRDGSSTVGQWGRDVRMAPDVVSVRQNLNLLVDHGQPVPGLNSADTTQWGYTLGNAVYVWRSGLGVTADGALVYVGGPGLDITDLANILVRAGAVRAMELDINTDWVNFSSYQPATPTGAATPSNGSELLSNMTGSPGRYFASWWARDFITMSAAPGR